VSVAGSLAPSQLEVVAAGVQLPRVGYLRPTEISLVKRTERGSSFRIALPGGKVRQVRALCTALHLRIDTIHRVRIGPVKLGPLKPGRYRNLSSAEIEGIREGA